MTSRGVLSVGKKADPLAKPARVGSRSSAKNPGKSAGKASGKATLSAMPVTQVTAVIHPMVASTAHPQRSVQDWLQLALLRSEKCELGEARESFLAALELASQGSQSGDEKSRRESIVARMEAIAGLLRIAGEALDTGAIAHWDRELGELMRRHPDDVPAIAWYCKGAIARMQKRYREAQIFFHRYIRIARERPETSSFNRISPEEAIARGWVMIAVVLWSRMLPQRAIWISDKLLELYSDKPMPAVLGMVYMLRAGIDSYHQRFDSASRWYQQAQATFLSSHNWYYYLYVLLGQARLARYQQNYVQANWYLDLLEKAASDEVFGLLRSEVEEERSKLSDDAVDLVIDSRQCLVRTREGGEISLGKQYVLLHILEALSKAHGRPGDDHDRGLSKAEIIQFVWKEAYRPEIHDNKLYFNINRLRKLIEPDVRKPQYLLSWRNGYRLAPGLKVQFLSGRGPSAGPAGELSESHEGGNSDA